MRDRLDLSKLLAASFVSQVGSHFLTLALSAYVLVTTKSLVQSSLIFVVSYLPSVFVANRLGRWVDREISKHHFAMNELISTITSLACGLSLYLKWPFYVLCLVLGGRSILLFTSRSFSMKWIKLISAENLQAKRAKIFFLIFFVSTAVSGLLASFVLSRFSIFVVVGLDIVTYLISCLLILWLDSEPMAKNLSLGIAGPGGNERGPLGALVDILDSQEIRPAFLLVCGSQALFQGGYSVLVSLLPIHRFGLGMDGVGTFQLAASAGIIGGFLINWFVPQALSDRSKVRGRSLGFCSLAILALLASTTTSRPMVAVFLFGVLNFAYECVWLHNSSDFFRLSPKTEVARYQFALTSFASFLMAVWTLGYALAIENFGLGEGTMVFVAMGLGAAVTLPAMGRLALRKHESRHRPMGGLQ